MTLRHKKIALAAMTGLSISVALAGCATDASSTAEADDAPSSASTPAGTAPGTDSGSDSGSDAGSDATTDDSASADSAGVYTDGTYEAMGTYTSPNGQEEIDVSITLAGDVITAVTVTPEASNPQAVSYQKQFADGIAEVVVGKSIDEIEVSRVAGSSLTSGGFNEAVEAIKAEAS
jgi:hypothetical protein